MNDHLLVDDLTECRNSHNEVRRW